MAEATGTFDTYTAVGNREELANAIYMLSPEDTPLLTLLGREPVTSTHPEWQSDSLAAPADNAQLEGDTFSYSAPSTTSRLGNYTQISYKTLLVSRTQEKTSKAGRKSELKYQLRKQGAELKKDMEFAYISNKASVAGAAGTSRHLAGFPAWLTTNVNRGSTGSSGGFSSGTGLVSAATDGTKAAFTKANMDTVLRTTYQSGGNPTTMMLSPANKVVFSGFTGIASLRANQNQGSHKQMAIFQGADVYVSDFGVIDVVPNRVMVAGSDQTPSQNVLFITPDMAKVGIFDDIQMISPAQDSDGSKRVLIVEHSLIMRNEAAHGVCADTFGIDGTTT